MGYRNLAISDCLGTEVAPFLEFWHFGNEALNWQIAVESRPLIQPPALIGFPRTRPDGLSTSPTLLSFEEIFTNVSEHLIECSTLTPDLI